MPLSDEQRAKVLALAEELGADPAEAERIAEEEAGEPEPRAKESPEAKPAAATAAEPALKPYQWNAVVLRVREIRKMLGVEDEKFPDQDLPFLDWMAKHGGNAPAPTPSNDEVTKAE